MRLSLDELKAMSSRDLEVRWFNGEFPFDAAQGCGQCLTQHGNESFECSLHSDLRQQMYPLWKKMPGQHALHVIIEELYALRLFFDALYTQATPGLPEAIAEDAAHAKVGAK